MELAEVRDSINTLARKEDIELVEYRSKSSISSLESSLNNLTADLDAKITVHFFFYK